MCKGVGSEIVELIIFGVCLMATEVVLGETMMLLTAMKCWCVSEEVGTENLTLGVGVCNERTE